MKLNKKILTIAGVSIIVVIIACLLNSPKDTIIDKIKRPSYSDTKDTYSLMVKTDSGEYDVEIPVEPQQIPLDELQKYFDMSYEIVCKEMLGENSAPDNVRTDLNFISEIEAYGINVDYTTDNYDLVNCFGEVKSNNALPEGSACTITMTFEYEGNYQSYKQNVIIMPPDYTEEELLINKINAAIDKANSEADGEYLILPNEIDGVKISFVEKAESRLPIIIILLTIVFLLWYYKKFIVKKNLEKEREQKLSMDYSEIVSKLSLLMGAGMSGASAFAKISNDYINALKKSKMQKRPAYEEILTASNRIASGVSEADAYAMFGRSCRIHCYVKLGSLMAQNIRKGGDDFIEALKAETTEAFIERKSMARKAGEEAGTKLLLPMGIMLCIVLVIIIVPAFMSF